MASGIIGKSGYVTLWTNPNPTDVIFVYFKRDQSTLMLNPFTIFKPYILDNDNVVPFVVVNIVTGGGQLGRRIFKVSKTQIEFTNADRYNSYGGNSVGANATLIPDKIIGVKF